MNLVRRILDTILWDVFTDTELVAMFPGRDASRYNQIKRALASGDLMRIRRGLYCLAPRFRRHPLQPYALAQRIHGPSYVSFESALAYYQLIPEAVYDVTSACVGRSRQFKTPLGVFSYLPVPASVLFECVERVDLQGTPCLMATPLKALADYVYTKRLDGKGVTPLLQSLRIDLETLTFSAGELDALTQAYPSARVSHFLVQLRQEIDP